MKIIYVGSLDVRGNSFRRFTTLGLLGHQTQGINIEDYFDLKFLHRLQYHLNVGPGIISINKKVLKLVKTWSADVLFVDNKSYVTASTLKKIRSLSPSIKIINLITDDPITHKMAWRLSLNSAKYYDILFVQRAVNIQELKNYGAKRVELCYRSFDCNYHRKIDLLNHDKIKYKNQIGFIGNYEKEREDYIAHLIKNGLHVTVVGGGWEKGAHWDVIKPYYGGPPLFGDEYVKFINGLDIALHFLRHENRDEQDSRTFEIPACGTFMIAEFSEVHKDLFSENKEAIFFSSKDELLTKILYYIGNPEERQKIAEGGYHRCLTSGYDHHARLQYVLKKAFSVE